MAQNPIPTGLSQSDIFDSAPTPLIMASTGGTILLVNSEAESLFGYTRDELQRLSIEDLVPERFRSGHAERRQRFHKSDEKRGMSSRADLFTLKSDGTEFPVEVLLSPIHANGELYVVAAVIDLTERKRREEELRLSYAALEKSNMELQQFAYVASHDLQTPLRGIAGFAQILQSDYRSKLGTEADDRLDRIVAGVKQMQQVIDDFLVFTSVDRQVRPFVVADLNAVFEQVLATLAPSIDETGARVTRGELPAVECNPAQITHLLQNLIANALAYHGEKRPEVHVSAERRGDDWLVAIRDNGIGVAPRYHEKIFEIFRRLHTSAKYPGTGIGLAICRRIVDQHGGRIWLESAQGEGATFYFTLPLKRREAA